MTSVHSEPLAYAESADDVLEPIPSEIDDADSSPPEYRISTYPADFTLQVLHEKWKDGDLVVPRFQRQFVWNLAQSSKLIESFLHGLPVPPVYLYTERATGKFLVVDGQQRLKTVFYFLEGFFGEENHRGQRKVFRLQGLSDKSPWANKSFEMIAAEDQRSAKKLLNAVLRSFVVEQLDPEDDTSIFHIFERLNTGGTPLAGQEIRNCIYSGKLNERIKELNQDASWRALFGKPLPDIHMRDEELIVRVLALSSSLETYDKPMKDFLSRFMRRYRDSVPDALESMIAKFSDIAAELIDQLEERPFHIRAGLNAAVCDSVFVCLMNHVGALPEDLSSRYQSLLRDEGYLKATATGTTDVDTIKDRIKAAAVHLTA